MGGVLLYQVKRDVTVISPDRAHVASFDREGRLTTFFREGSTFKRSLASQVHERHVDGVRQRSILDPAASAGIFAEAIDLAASVAESGPPELRDRLESEVLPWTPQALLAEGERFQHAYSWPISILPPDCYLNVVVQATFGCTWNKCTFCNFYQDRDFRARAPEELREHIGAVKDLLGQGLRLRKGVFLADGNALALGPKRVEPLVQEVRDAFPGEPWRAFVDVFTGERHDRDHWARLRELGLERVYVGLESGLDRMLAFLNKPGSRAAAVQFVTDLKAAGIAVGLILMVGVGGREMMIEHREASLAALRAMPLDRADLVYLSPFVEHPGSLYAERRAAEGLTPLTEAEVEAELALVAGEVRATGIRAARYDIREFIY
jgi:radical SAM superfamily enzyme YgiQ (UPF0313 family)